MREIPPSYQTPLWGAGDSALKPCRRFPTGALPNWALLRPRVVPRDRRCPTDFLNNWTPDQPRTNVRWWLPRLIGRRVDPGTSPNIWVFGRFPAKLAPTDHSIQLRAFVRNYILMHALAFGFCDSTRMAPGGISTHHPPNTRKWRETSWAHPGHPTTKKRPKPLFFMVWRQTRHQNLYIYVVW